MDDDDDNDNDNGMTKPLLPLSSSSSPPSSLLYLKRIAFIAYFVGTLYLFLAFVLLAIVNEDTLESCPDPDDNTFGYFSPNQEVVRWCENINCSNLHLCPWVWSRRVMQSNIAKVAFYLCDFSVKFTFSTLFLGQLYMTTKSLGRWFLLSCLAVVMYCIMNFMLDSYECEDPNATLVDNRFCILPECEDPTCAPIRRVSVAETSSVTFKFLFFVGVALNGVAGFIFYHLNN